MEDTEKKENVKREKVKKNKDRNLIELISMIVISIFLFFSAYYITTELTSKKVCTALAKIGDSADFYNNAYSNLISTVAALYTGLIAVTIAIFAFQKWFEGKKYNELKEETENFIASQKEVIPAQIRETFDKNKADLSQQLKKFVENYIKSEVASEHGKLVSSRIRAELEYLSKEERFFYSKEQFKNIVSKMNLNFSDVNTFGSILAYEEMIGSLLDILDKEYKETGDKDFVRTLVVLQAHLMFVEQKGSAIEYHGFAELKEKIENLINRKCCDKKSSL